MPPLNRYGQIIERIFLSKYQDGMCELEFVRQDIVDVAEELGIAFPKNVGDVIYSFRYRNPLPDSIESKAPEGHTWIICSVGRSRYCFVAVTEQAITPNPILAETKIPDATPGIATCTRLVMSKLYWLNFVITV